MSNELPNVRLQNLRDFTVQIRHATTDAIVGTGIVVSTGGTVVTCAHVVVAAGVNPRLGTSIPGIWESIFGRAPGALADAKDAEVGVYFPQARGGEIKARRATVAACFSEHDDDVVVLQLVGGPAPLGPEQIAVLGEAEGSEGHGFRSYGYRRLADYIAGHAHGAILGLVESPAGRSARAEPVQLASNQINQGMSGAAVLDTERNLVVGIVSETWYPDNSGKDRDTAWAVDSRVLTFDPFSLPVQVQSLDKRPAQQPKTDIAEARAAVAPEPGISLNGAPPPLAEWVGRDELLRAISHDWLDPDRRVTGLIGFGGEGKSSLARRWLDDLLNSPLPPGEGTGVRAKGVFWWGFYDKPNVDEFFEAALKYMGGGQIDPRQYPSSNAKAHLIAAMLSAGRYLFVLDGLEVMQHQEGDEYGLLKSGDLREFLGYFAAPGHPSFCLITSRAPLLDLMDYTTYTHRDVDRLSPADGRALLRKIGVHGSDAALDKVVADWDGHALTLSLLGAYLVERHAGDVAHIRDIPVPTAGEERYERVHRVLRRYDEHLTEAGRAFLTLFSAFRTPVDEAAFEKVFRAKVDVGATSWSPLHAPIAALEDAAFDAMIRRLVDYRILRHDLNTRQYTTHPLIRAHYLARLTAGDHAQTQAAHERIKDYYLSIAGETPYNPTLDDLKPLIEVVHHACRAGAYDEAIRVLKERIYQTDRFVIYHQLGAYETDLALLLEFFPGDDTLQEPQVSDPSGKGWILNEVGLCLMSLGRLREAVPFYQRANVIQLGLKDWHNASITYQNLAGLHVYLGALDASADAAREALALVRRAENKQDECASLAYRAWVAHLHGELEAAGAAFKQAEALQREIDSTKNYLYSERGFQHADHLRRAGDMEYAQRITEANLEICEPNHWPDELSQCHRVLGDLDADAGQHDSARKHYDEALRIARGISRRDVLIEALLARGWWYARHMKDANAAFSDLNEALGYTIQSGYRIYEADIRIGLAWAHLTPGPSPTRRGEIEAARAEAERARGMSVEMGYHWGQVDVEEVMERMKAEG